MSATSKTKDLIAPQWVDNVREDGLRVVRGVDCWVIQTREGIFLSACPCCGSALRSDRAARLVADFVYRSRE